MINITLTVVCHSGAQPIHTSDSEAVPSHYMHMLITIISRELSPQTPAAGMTTIFRVCLLYHVDYNSRIRRNVIFVIGKLKWKTRSTAWYQNVFNAIITVVKTVNVVVWNSTV